MEARDFSENSSVKNININDGFWGEYIKLVKNEVIPYQLKALGDEIDGAPKSHCIENFKKAAKANEARRSGKITPIYPTDKWEYTENNSDINSFLGWCFQDSDLYKWLEAVGYLLEKESNTQLKNKADELIDLICSAQLENGYLDTLYIINDTSKAFTNLKDRHELYCFGHLTEAAISYSNATGNGKLLDCAVRFADLICDTFSREKLCGYPGHEICELALIKLYRQTKNVKYLKQADFFISQRGTKPYYFDIERGFERKDNSLDYFYNQAHIPPILQNEAVGHAVRGVYLYTAMADLAKETDNNGLFEACLKIWNNIENKKLYITGGIGATADGEAFSFDYDLPNDTAYCETCASIGLMFFALKMLDISPESRYADVMERALYNTVLASVSQDGKSFFYVNPLEVSPKASKEDSRKRHIKPTRQKWFGCACCPPNFARLIASLGKYTFSESESDVYIHLYVGGEIESEKAKINIISDYEKSGKVQFNIKANKPFSLALRIPYWCDKYSINSEYEIRRGYAYIKIDCDCKINIEFEIKPEIIKCSNKVKYNIGKAAVMRGPTVYCAEEADNGNDLQRILLDVSKRPIYNKNDGSITAFGFREEADDKLYYKYTPAKRSECKIKLIPYRLWGNRGENEMTVYLRCCE